MTSYKTQEVIDVINNNRTIRIAKKHEHYLWELNNNFEHYWNAVIPIDNLIDCSTPRVHHVRGFDYYDEVNAPWCFNSLPESTETINQYIQLLGIPKVGSSNIKSKQTIFDLGGYSGLSSVLFSYAGHHKVVCVEPDPTNLKLIDFNLKNQNRVHQNLFVHRKAVWSHTNGIDFISDGNLGSSSFIADTRGTKIKVPTTTLSELAEIYNPVPGKLFIKVDIEGAETEIFKNEKDFLIKYSPTIVVEAHRINNELTTNQFTSYLEIAGYHLEIVNQIGSHDPLILAKR